MAAYEAPATTDMGSLSEVTLGGPWSRCDGHSGTAGNRGQGGGGCEDKTGGRGGGRGR